uniref:Uncharacterized protein n=1 Tax=Otus sunia TaxID=257818 RepID=A0A8C8AV39_9STRI
QRAPCSIFQPSSFLSGRGGAESWDRVRDTSASGSAAPSVTGLYRAPSRVEQEASARVSAAQLVRGLRRHLPTRCPSGLRKSWGESVTLFAL